MARRYGSPSRPASSGRSSANPRRLARVLLLVGCLVPAAAAAKYDLPMAKYRDHYDRMKRLHAETHPAAVVEHLVEVKVSPTKEYYNGEVRITKAIGIFDPSQADRYLKQEFFLTGGEKLGDLQAWSWEDGKKNPTWLEKRDIHVTEVFGGVKLVRFVIPGLSGPGLVGFRYETKSDYPGYVSAEFASELPVARGNLVYEYPRPGTSLGGRWGHTRFATRVHRIIYYGEGQENVSETGGIWRTTRISFFDLPAQSRNPYVLEEDDVRGEVHLVPPQFHWGTWSAALEEFLAEMDPPEGLKDWIEELDLDGDEPDTVAAAASYLNDPGHFRLIDYGLGGGGDPLEECIENREGTAWNKALLAHLMLRELGIESRLMMTSSIFEKDLSQEIVWPFSLDRILLEVPGRAFPEFLWDVAEPAVPFGRFRPDYFADMFGPWPEGTYAWRTMDLRARAASEERRLATWAFRDDGGLTGSVDWRIVSAPQEFPVPLWEEDGACRKALEDEITGFFEVDSVSWDSPGGFLLDYSTPVTLSVRGRSEASPYGEAGWSLQALPWREPAVLERLAVDPEQSAIVVPEDVTIADEAKVIITGYEAGELPDANVTVNAMGSVKSSWSSDADTVFVVRELRIVSQKLEPGYHGQLEELRTAWRESSPELRIRRAD